MYMFACWVQCNAVSWNYSSDTRVSALSGNVNLWVKSRRRRRGAINRFGPVKWKYLRVTYANGVSVRTVEGGEVGGVTGRLGKIDVALWTTTDTFVAPRRMYERRRVHFLVHESSAVRTSPRGRNVTSRRIGRVDKGVPIWGRRCFALLRFYENSGYDLSRVIRAVVLSEPVNDVNLGRASSR